MMSKYKNVLLVEDDVDDQKFFAQVFEEVAPESSWTITSNGQQALNRLLDSLPDIPDLIFLDLHMPLLDGFEFLRIIKSGGKYAPFKYIPIMVLSTSPAFEEKCYALGASKFLTKPYSVDQFHDMLVNLLMNRVH
jgi:CheY-like chemotaxis protein